MKTHVIPINIAEAVMDPFWDPALSTLPLWNIETGSTGAVDIEQIWCHVAFRWERFSENDRVLTMIRQIACDVAAYDTILVSMVAGAGSTVELSVTDSTGVERSGRFVTDGLRHEYPVTIGNLSTLASIRFTVTTKESDGAGWMNWIGLQHSDRLKYHLDFLDEIAKTIPMHVIEPENPTFAPRYGLVFSERELEAIRKRADEFVPAVFEHRPSELISDFILNGPDTRYCREREHGLNLLGLAKKAAVSGVIRRDAKLLLRAAEYAIAEALTPYWDWGMLSRAPGSAFEIRSFMQEVVLEDLATVMDLAYEFLTPGAVELIKRRMAEDGIGNINFVSWKHEYIHHCNQLPAFSSGRIAAYGILLQSWPRVEPYLDLAADDLTASLTDTVLSDGGFVEGPAYFHYTMSRGLVALKYYARATGKTFLEVVPDAVISSSRFADAIYSTDPDQDHIAICDAHAYTNTEFLARLASLMPESMWTTMYREKKARARTEVSPEEIVFDEQIPAKGPVASSFVYLPEMRLASSCRMHDGKTVKLLVLGNRGGAGHTHEDKGSFVLEYANCTIAMDPGICRYDHPLTPVLKYAQRHNMLVPVGIEERARPDNPLGGHVDIDASGDGDQFHAKIDCTPGWAKYYRRWMREYESPRAAEIVIRDRYELLRGSGVAFLLQTIQPVNIDGREVFVGKAEGMVSITAPENARISMVELELPESDAMQRCISFEMDGVSGAFEVVIRML